jgi:hypothetical protein
MRFLYRAQMHHLGPATSGNSATDVTGDATTKSAAKPRRTASSGRRFFGVSSLTFVLGERNLSPWLVSFVVQLLQLGRDSTSRADVMAVLLKP